MEQCEPRVLLSFVKGRVLADAVDDMTAQAFEGVAGIGVYIDKDGDAEYDLGSDPFGWTNEYGEFLIDGLGVPALNEQWAIRVDDSNWQVTFGGTSYSGTALDELEFGVRPLDPLAIAGPSPVTASGDGSPTAVITLIAATDSVVRWRVDWGDGTAAEWFSAHFDDRNRDGEDDSDGAQKAPLDTYATVITHEYATPARREVHVVAEFEDGTLQPVTPRGAEWKIDHAFSGGSADARIFDFGGMFASQTSGTGAKDGLYAIQAGEGGMAYVGGWILKSGGTNTSDFIIARVKGSGDLDTDFGAPIGGSRRGYTVVDFNGSKDEVRELIVFPESAGSGTPRVVAGGVAKVSGVDKIGIVALDDEGDVLPDWGSTNGNVIIDFGSTAPLTLRALERDSSNAIVVVATDSDHVYIARLLSSGYLDPSFGGGVGWVAHDLAEIYDVAEIADPEDFTAEQYWLAPVDVDFGGGVFGVGGYALTISAGGPPPAPEYDVNASVFLSFGADGALGADPEAIDPGFVVTDVLRLADGKFVMVGEKSAFGSGGQYDIVVARYLPNGDVDESFGTADGRIVLDWGADNDDLQPRVEGGAGGVLTIVAHSRVDLTGGTSAEEDFFIAARLTPSGLLDETFGTGGMLTALASTDFARSGGMAITDEGAVWIAGIVDDGGTSARDSAIVRFTGTGLPVASMNLDAVVERLDTPSSGLNGNDPGWLSLNLSVEDGSLGLADVKGWVIAWGDGDRELVQAQSDGSVEIEHIYDWADRNGAIRAWALTDSWATLSQNEGYFKTRPQDRGHLVRVPLGLDGLLTIDATVREFSTGHLDFGNAAFDRTSIQTGMVGAGLVASTDLPNLVAGTLSGQATSQQSFDEWFADDHAMQSQVALRLLDRDVGRGLGDWDYHFVTNTVLGSGDKREDFTPLDFHPVGTQTPYFTLESQFFFTYHEIANVAEYLHFSSGGDLWVFVNNQLVIDLGGSHPQLPAMIAGDDTPQDPLDDEYGTDPDGRAELDELGLTEGGVYPIHVFYAHRHSQSPPRLTFRTNLDIQGSRIHIEEEDRFRTGAWNDGGYAFEILDNAETLRLGVDVAFDNESTSTTMLRDAFELALVDEQGMSVVPVVGAGSDAFYSVSEGRPARMASGVAWDEALQEVVLDISRLPAQTSVRLIARLINNDTDTGSEATVDALPVQSSVALVVGEADEPTQPGAPVLVPPLDFELLEDVTPLFDLGFQDTHFNDETGIVRAAIGGTLSDGSGAIHGPILLVLDGLLPRAASGDPLSGRLMTLTPDGHTPDGMPYWDVSQQVLSSANAGSPGSPVIADSTAFTVTPFAILDQALAQFDFALRVLAAPNRAPVIQDSPVPSVVRGETQLSLQFEAIDPDGDAIHPIDAWRVDGPSGASIDASGRLTWTAPANHVIETFMISAQDEWGAWSEPRIVTVRVQPDLPNRAPEITSTPIVTAIVGQRYSYRAVAHDIDGDATEWLALGSGQTEIPIPGAEWTAGQLGSDPDAGLLEWTPGIDDLGEEYLVTLRVKDVPPQGLTQLQDAQTFRIRVVADPINHDPYFVTEPATEHSVVLRSGGFSSSGATISDADVLDQPWVWLDEGEHRSLPITLSVTPSNTLTAEVVFLLDVSDSMIQEAQWLLTTAFEASIPAQLHAELSGLGFEAIHFGFVAIGPRTDSSTSNPIWVIEPAEPAASAWWDIASIENDYANLQMALSPQGGGASSEDAFASVQEFLDSLVNGPLTGHTGAQRSLVVITDEDRQVREDYESVQLDTLVTALRGDGSRTSDDIIVHGVLNHRLFDDGVGEDGEFGVLEDGTSTGWTATPLRLSGSAEAGSRTTLFADNLETLIPEWVPLQDTTRTVVRTAMNVTTTTGIASILFAYIDEENYDYASIDVVGGTMALGLVRQGQRSEVTQPLDIDLNGAEWLDAHLIVDSENHTVSYIVSRASIKGEGDSDGDGPTGDPTAAGNEQILERGWEGVPDPAPNVDPALAIRVESGHADFLYVWFFEQPQINPLQPEEPIEYLEVFGADPGSAPGADPVIGRRPSGAPIYISTPSHNPGHVESTIPLSDDLYDDQFVSFHNIRADYVSLVRATGGTEWDLNQISSVVGNTSFGDVFVSTLALDILAHSISVDSSSPLFVGATVVGVVPGAMETEFLFDIEFEGDGLSQRGEIEFVEGSNGAVVGTLPVAFNPRYVYDARAIDPDRDEVLYESEVLDLGAGDAALAESSHILWEPMPIDSGLSEVQAAFTITASDGRGGAAEQTWSVALRDAGWAGTSPTWNGSFVQSVQQGQDFVLDLSAFVTSGSELHFSLLLVNEMTEMPPGVALTRSGLLTWRVDRFQALNEYQFKVRVSNGDSEPIEGEFTIDIVAPTPNARPAFTSLAPNGAAVNHEYRYLPRVHDDDGHARHTFELIRSPRGMGINPENGELRWVPKEDQVGSHIVMLRAWDGRDGWTVQSVVVDVHPRNSAPEWQVIPEQEWSVEFADWTFPLVAIEPDGDPVEFRVLEGPDDLGVALVGGEPTLTWADPVVGRHRIVVEAVDGRGGSSEAVFNLNVLAQELPTQVIVEQRDSGLVRTVSGAFEGRIGVPTQLRIRAVGPSGEAALLDPTGRMTLPTGMTLQNGNTPAHWPSEEMVFDWTPATTGRGVLRIPTLSYFAPGTLPGGIPFDVQVLEIPVVALAAGESAAIISSVGPKVTAAGLPLAYQFEVRGLPQDAEDLEWELEVAPGASGLQIDSSSGLLTAPAGVTIADDRPIGQAAMFTVRVLDSSTPGITLAERTYTLPVLDNAPPAIVELPRKATLNQPLEMTFRDPNGLGDRGTPYEAFVVTLTLPAQGAVVASGVGADIVLNSIGNGLYRAHFVLDEDAIGGAEPGDLLRFEWTVTDYKGDFDTRSAIIIYDDSVDDQAPSFADPYFARPTIATGQLYVHKARASDPDGDDIEFSIVDGQPSIPVGMTMSRSGLLLWRPTANDVGSEFSVVMRATANGESDDQAILIRVVSAPRNSDPLITSDARRGAVAGREYLYLPAAEDPDQDSLFWSFVKSPAGATINSETGRISWRPRDSQIGDQEFAVRVEDPYGGVAIQRFRVQVDAANTPPRLLSSFPEIGWLGQQVEVPLRAVDFNGDAIEFLISVDGGDAETVDGVFDGSTGEWTAPWQHTPMATGARSIAVTAREKWPQTPAQNDSQTYVMLVVDGEPGDSPRFLSEPGRRAVDDMEYRTELEVSAAPASLSRWVRQSGGDWRELLSDELFVVTVPAQEEDFDVSVEAVFADGDPGDNPSVVSPTTKLTWHVEVVDDNHAPVLRPLDNLRWVTSGAADQQFAFNVSATDRDLDRLRYSMYAPAGAAIDPRSGRITWSVSSPPAVGTHHVVVSVTDGMLFDTETYEVEVVRDDAGPVVSLLVPAFPLLDEESVIWVDAYDPSGVDVLQAWIVLPDDSEESARIDRDGGIRYTFSQSGDYSVRIVARDTLGNEGGIDPGDYIMTVENPDDPAPRIEWISLGFGETVTSPRTITVQVSDVADQMNAEVTLSVYLEVYNEQGTTLITSEPASQQYTSGDPPVEEWVMFENQAALQLDPTTLRNGAYTLGVVASDGNATRTYYVPFNVDGDLKLGNFRMSFTDLEVPVGGLPVAVQRTYDTLNTGRDGDLGRGWELDLIAAGITADSDTLDPFPNPAGRGFVPAFTTGTRLTVTLPNGSREGYTFVPIPRGKQTGWGAVVYDAAFVPDPGNTTTLDFTGERPLPGIVNDGGAWTDISGQFPFNPALELGSASPFRRDYYLYLQDGTRFLVQSDTGRTESVVDLEGNVLQISDGGVAGFNNAGEETASLLFSRDALGRITRITDPAGNYVSYGYDVNSGLLTTISDRVGDITTLAYGGDSGSLVPADYLSSIRDARGVVVAEMQYAVSSGALRLEAIVDAAGQAAGFAYTTDHPESSGHKESVTDAANHTIELIRDDDGRVVRKIEKLPEGDNYEVIGYLYDANGFQAGVSIPRTVSIADRYDAELFNPDEPTHWESRSTYDDFGNMLTQTDALGRTTTYTYDIYGNPETTTSPGSGTTINIYGTRARLLRTENVETGQVTEYDYDFKGNLKSLSRFIDGQEVEVSRFEYDSAGRIIRSDKPDISAGGDAEIAQHIIYDELGRQVVSYRTQKGSDASVVTMADRTDYDAEGRAVRVRHYQFAGAHEFTSASALDAESPQWETTTGYQFGRVVRSTDRYGAESITRYDARGLVVESRTESKSWDGADYVNVTMRSLMAYDDNGRESARTSPFSADSDRWVMLTVPTYDEMGRTTDTTTYLVDPDELSTVLSVVEDPAYDDSNPQTDPIVFKANLSDDQTFHSLLTAGNIVPLTQSSTVFDAEGRVGSSHMRFWHDGDWVEQAATEYTYNDDGAQHTVTRRVDLDQDGDSDDSGETLTTTYLYDDAGRQLQVLSPRGSPGASPLPADRAVEYRYDTAGRVISTVQLGDLSTSSDDIFGVTGYDELGRRTSETDALGRTTEYRYDTDGRLIAVILPEVFDPEARARVHPTYEYTYDSWGNMVQIKAPGTSGGIERLTQFAFDALGRQVSRTLPLGVSAADGTYTETMSYDDGPLSMSTGERDFAASGQMARGIDFEGRVTLYRYDNSPRGGGRAVQRLHLRDAAAADDYDTADALTTRALGDSPALPSDAERFTDYFDEFGRIILTVHEARDPAGQSTTRETRLTYDDQGRLIRTETPEGVLEYEYDAAGRQTAVQTRRGWDGLPDGSTAFPVQQRTEYTFDAFDRIIRVEVAKRNGSSTGGEHTRYFYDREGNVERQELWLPHDGPQHPPVLHLRARWTFDDFGRIASLKWEAPHPTTPDTFLPIATFLHGNDDEPGYYADGSKRMVREEWTGLANYLALVSSARTSETFWTYDALNRLASERFVFAPDSELPHVYAVAYSLDIMGNRLSKVEDWSTTSGLSDAATTYTYNSNDQLLSEYRDVVDITPNSSDDLRIDYLWTATEQTRRTTLAAAPNVNDLGVTMVPREVTDYTYSLRGRLESARTERFINPPQPDVDPQGNSTGGTEATYRYDERGLRVRESLQKFDAGGGPVGPATDRAIHFNAMNPTGYAQIVEELVPDGGGGWQVARSSTIGLDVISTSAASGDRGLLHSYDSDAPMAMLYDAGGSVRALFSPEPGAGSFSPAFVELDDDPNRTDDDDAAVRVQVFDYDAFGQLLRVTAGIGGPSNGPPATDPGGVPAWRFAANTPSSEFAAAHATFALSTLLYRGEQFDAHLRMQYLRARHYDQATGRFTRVDPFAGVSGQPLTLHKYAYAHGDPTNGSDPSGLFASIEINLTQLVAYSLASFSVLTGLLDLRQAASYAIQARTALLAGDVWRASALSAAAAITGGLGLLNIALGVAGFRTPPASGLKLAFQGLSTQGSGAIAIRGAWIAIESSPAMRQWVWSRVVPALFGFFFAAGPGSAQGGSGQGSTQATRDTKPRIENGNSREGWQHIDERHVSGTSPAGPGDLFAPGTTRAQITRLAEQLVSGGQRISKATSRIQVYERRATVNGLHARYRVVVDSHDGNRVISIFPALSE
jgi:RHS repeat-associated protein/fibro-slime domain-containing protein